MPTVSNNKNPFITAEVDSDSIRDTLLSLTAGVTGMTSRAADGLLNVAYHIQARARANVRPYKYQGRLHDAIKVKKSSRSTPNFIRVTVGIHSRDCAPAGATLERGWASAKGLRPPVEPLAAWAIRRGLARNYSQARNLGFLISRKMGERGYSFHTRPWFAPAVAAESGALGPTVERFMMTSVGRPPLPKTYRLSGIFDIAEDALEGNAAWQALDDDDED